MIFQTFDDKDQCALIYQNGKFFNTQGSLDMTSTWGYANYLCDKDIEYAQLWVQGSSLSASCPSYLEPHLQEVEDRLKAFIRSCALARVNLDDLCFYELVPHNFLRDYAHIKNEVSRHVFQKFKRPDNYHQLLKIVKVVSDIRYRSIGLDLTKMSKASIRDRNMFKTLSSCKRNVVYDPFKTITGRLTTTSRTFPALTLAREYRKVVAPTNDWLFELDFNAAELRTVLALLGEAQPDEDLHDWNIKNIFSKDTTREEAKKKIFAWLYNPNNTERDVNALYNRDKIKEAYFTGEQITTDFSRTIPCDEFHATNYVIQSTAADLLFEQMYDVWEYLRDKKSFIKFCNHDSIMIDLSLEDQGCINEIKEIFSNTRYGKFKINCAGGKSWGAMKQLLVH
tara:strand:+ start:191 stop:1375 length:1185 start_codon:yes stop_codon:yes gene_type:complete